eukprot:TRINITY_DN10770_c0_g1_i1.p1 TRINITY_DN10770_c0_g1~~TRINITY_DN10770_c0_g1_i1.p1  ORF type:complete len:1496 (+),score=384.67 TRINITY_DN10770_c0_g1_i1:3-4490(+)
MNRVLGVGDVEAVLFLLRYAVWFPGGEWVVTRSTRAIREALREDRLQMLLLAGLQRLLKQQQVALVLGILASPHYPAAPHGRAALVGLANSLHLFYPPSVVTPLLRQKRVRDTLRFDGLCPHGGFILPHAHYYTRSANPLHRLVYKLCHERAACTGRHDGSPTRYPFTTTEYLWQCLDVYLAPDSGVHRGLHPAPAGPPDGKLYPHGPEAAAFRFPNCVTDLEEVRRPFMSMYSTVASDRAIHAVTPLYIALRHGSVAMAQLLLERGAASANEVCCVGRQTEPYGVMALRPLTVAVGAAAIDCVRCLLAHGAEAALPQRVLHAPLPAALHPPRGEECRQGGDGDPGVSVSSYVACLIEDVWLRVCAYLPSVDVAQLGRTCLNLHALTAGNEVWAPRVARALSTGLRAALWGRARRHADPYAPAARHEIQYRFLRGKAFGLPSEGALADNISRPMTSSDSDAASDDSGASSLSDGARRFLALAEGAPAGSLQYPVQRRAALAQNTRGAVREGLELIPGTQHGVVDLRRMLRHNAALAAGAHPPPPPTLPGFDSYDWGHYDIYANGERRRPADLAEALRLVAEAAASPRHLAGVTTLYTPPAGGDATLQAVAYPLRWAVAGGHDALARALYRLLRSDVEGTRQMPAPMLGETVAICTPGSGASFTWKVEARAGGTDYAMPFYTAGGGPRAPPLPVAFGTLLPTLLRGGCTAAREFAAEWLASSAATAFPMCAPVVERYRGVYPPVIGWHVPEAGGGGPHPWFRARSGRLLLKVPARTPSGAHRCSVEPRSVGELLALAAAAGRAEAVGALLGSGAAEGLPPTTAGRAAAVRIGAYDIAGCVIQSAAAGEEAPCLWFLGVVHATTSGTPDAEWTADYAWCTLYEATHAALTAGAGRLATALMDLRERWLSTALGEAGGRRLREAVHCTLRWYFDALLDMDRHAWEGGAEEVDATVPLSRHHAVRARNTIPGSLLVAAVRADQGGAVQAMYSRILAPVPCGNERASRTVGCTEATCLHRYSAAFRASATGAAGSVFGGTGDPALSTAAAGITPLAAALKLAVALGAWRVAVVADAMMAAAAESTASQLCGWRGEPCEEGSVSEGEDEDEDEGEPAEGEVQEFGVAAPGRWWTSHPFAVVYDAEHPRRGELGDAASLYDVLGAAVLGASTAEAASLAPPAPLFPSSLAALKARRLLSPARYEVLAGEASVAGAAHPVGSERGRCGVAALTAALPTASLLAAALRRVAVDSVLLREAHFRERLQRLGGAGFSLLAPYFRAEAPPAVVLVVEPDPHGVDRVAAVFRRRAGVPGYRRAPIPGVYFPRTGQAVDLPFALKTQTHVDGRYSPARRTTSRRWAPDAWLLYGHHHGVPSPEAGPVDWLFPSAVPDAAPTALPAFGAVGVYCPAHRAVSRDVRLATLTEADLACLDAGSFSPTARAAAPVPPRARPPLHTAPRADQDDPEAYRKDAFYTLVVRVPMPGAVVRAVSEDCLAAVAALQPF